MTIKANFYNVESTSSNGWEYSFVLKGLGFKFGVCHLCIC